MANDHWNWNLGRPLCDAHSMPLPRMANRQTSKASLMALLQLLGLLLVFYSLNAFIIWLLLVLLGRNP